MTFQLPGMLFQNDDDDDDDDDEDESDDEVAAIRAQQQAAHFGWFDDLFIFNTCKLCFLKLICMLVFQCHMLLQVVATEIL